MSRFLVLNFKDFGLNQDITQTIQSQTLVCICCLNKNVQLINLATCKHSQFLDLLGMPKLDPEKKVVCGPCHSELKKIDDFRQQVLQSYNALLSENFNAADAECIQPKKLIQHKIVDVYLRPEKYVRTSPERKIKKNTEAVTKSKQTKPTNIPVHVKKKAIETTETKPSNTNNLDSYLEAHFDELMDPLAEVNEKTTDKLTDQKDNLKQEIEFVSDKINLTENAAVNLEDTGQTEQPAKKGKVKAVTLTKEELMRERLKLAVSLEYLSYPYRCENCLMGFQFEENVKDHMKRKHGPKVGGVTCDICLQVLYPPGSLHAHLYRHLTRYECEECGKRYPTFDDGFHHHFKEHRKKDPVYKCQFCNYGTDFLSRFQYHRYKHHKKYACKECGVVLATPASLWTHMRRVHKISSYKCVHCPTVSTSETEYGEHMQSHGADAAAAYCAPCDLQLDSWRAYNCHVTLSGSHRKHKYKCEECDMSFALDTHLRMHASLVHSKQPYKCPTCPRIFTIETELNEHIAKHKDNTIDDEYQCDYCGRSYFSRNHLIQHIQTHSAKLKKRKKEF